MSRRIRTAPSPVVAATVAQVPVAQAKAPNIATFTETDEPDEGIGETHLLTENLTLGGSTAAPHQYGLLSASVTYASASTKADDADGYIDRLLKYVPSEIIALYLGVSNVVPVRDPSYWISLRIIAIVVALCTPFYMYIMTSEKGEPTAWSQIAISSIAFPIWVFAIGGPFTQFSWYADKHWIAAVVLTFTTFLIGVHKPAPSPAAAPVKSLIA